MVVGDHIRTVMKIALFLALPLFSADHVAANEPQQQQPPPAVRKGDQALQFIGMVEPGRRMAVLLMPGENVKEMPIRPGQRVKNGDILVQLSNDQLVSGLADLQQKKIIIRENAQQSQLVKMEIAAKKEQITEIEEELDREKVLSETIKGYASTVTRQLQSQQKQLTGQLTILESRYELARELENENRALEKLVEDQILEVRKRIEALTIRSPLDGRVSQVAEEPNRTPPGGVICEIRDESFFMVRGTIIQHQYPLIAVGDTVLVSVDFIPGRSAHGVVESINQSLQRQQVQGYASFEVLIRVEDAQSLLQTGMVVSIEKPTRNP